MVGKKKCLAIIGLRSGSKGIKNKNIRLFRGKPLVFWIIEAAKNSKLINRIIISTDSSDYAKICRSYGAEVPFLRPEELSHDKSIESEYLAHALNWLKINEGYEPDFVSRLQATSPLQLPKDIDDTIEALINDPKANSSMAAFKSSLLPHKALAMDSNCNYIESYYSGTSSLEIQNRQEFKDAYYRGNIITSRYIDFIKTKKQVGKYSKLIEIPEERGVDINSELDLLVAETIAKKLGICKI